MALDTINSLTTLAEAKVWLAIKSDDTTYDGIVTKFINSVSAQFNSLTKRLLKARVITGYYDGDGSPVFMAPQYPINIITSIHIDSDRAYGDDTLIDAETYVHYSDGLIRADEDYFSKEPQAVKIIYNAGYGYDGAALPGDMITAAEDQIKWLYKRWLKNQEGIEAVTTMNGTTTITEAGEILKTSLEIMKRYMKRDHRSR